MFERRRFAFLCIFLSLSVVDSQETARAKLLVTTVAFEESDGLQRLRHSSHSFGIPLTIFGLDESRSANHIDDEKKLRSLRKGLEPYKQRGDLIVLYIDANYGILNGGEEEILERFLKYFGDQRIVFAADSECKPDKDLEFKYPQTDFGKRFLNSAMFMGIAPEIFRMITTSNIAENKMDFQAFFSHIYTDEEKRKSLKIGIDSRSRIFQSLDGEAGHLTLEFRDDGDAELHNLRSKTHPIVVTGDETSKLYLNYLGNYLGNAWSADHGCRLCPKGYEILKDGDGRDWPRVTLALFVSKPVPFVKEFLVSISKLTYPPSNIDLYIFNNQRYNQKDIENFVDGAKKRYHSVEIDNYDSDIGDREARRIAIDLAVKSSNEFAFLVDADVHFTESETLHSLIETSLTLKAGIIAPLVGKPSTMYTNFWGAVAEDGSYARSEDYKEIVFAKRAGVWNMPFVNSALLISMNKMKLIRDAFAYNLQADADISFCEFAREKGHFMFLDNQRYYGFLAESETFDSTKLHPEMYQIFDNRYLWESRYVHPDYFNALNGNEEIPQPCPDVYDYPLMSETFAQELIEEMEHYGKWSSGSNKDDRLAGGYENVPTVDIHMNQIGFDRQWLYFLDEYVRPMQEKVFIGYYQKPVDAVMMFVVRYHPNEQPSLRAHHDASTYTVDIPLNKRGRDYEGGGVRYVRYNCTLAADQIGYAAMFPGRLTHLHEGLPTTKGTRYIAVSFLNP